MTTFQQSYHGKTITVYGIAGWFYLTPYETFLGRYPTPGDAFDAARRAMG